MDLSELKPLLDAQNRAFEEFKRANDERLRAVETKGYAPADVTEKVERLNAALSDIGKQMNAIEAKAARAGLGGAGDGGSPEEREHKAAFARFLRKGDDAGLAEFQRKAMNTGSDPDGGYLVLPEMDKSIDRIAPTISSMYRLANIVTIGTAKYEKLVKKSGMAMRRVADGSGGGETTEPTYARIEIPVHTAEVEPWVNNETLEDAFYNLEADLAMEAGIAFAEGAGSEFISGNGVGKARGITAYSNVANASYAWGSVGYIASGKSAAFASVAPADKIVDLVHALPVQYRTGAAFLCNDALLGTIRQMKDSSGSYYLWQPDPTAPFGGKLLGYEVALDNNLAAAAAGSYSLAFGNFKRGYAIVNRTGTTLIRDNITSKGVTKMNFRRRFSGGITNFEAIRLMKFATS
jgi:HK97 family phage major capsid protein